MNNIYRKVETEQTQKRLKSEKETKSQLKAANRVLQKQNRDLRDQIVDDRDAIINKAKQKGVVNWANAAPDTWQELSQNSYSPDMQATTLDRNYAIREEPIEERHARFNLGD